MKKIIILAPLAAIVILLSLSAIAFAQEDGDPPPPYECDDRFGQCGTPEQSGGGGGGGGGGSILVNNTDLGDTYQNADDYDDDGVEDPYDNCPRVANPDQADQDGDDVGNACDNCMDNPNSDQKDLDGDRIGDICDTDKDGDDIIDTKDNCPMTPNPIIAAEGVQADLDNDGEGDACDNDIDDDGKDNLVDPCPMSASITDPTAAEKELCFPDMDGDGISELDPLSPDKCPTVYDPDQEDADDDGLGDLCDPDIDDDGIQNPVDNCPLVLNPEQDDADRDGAGDSCDNKFCYVVMGDSENCLDPDDAFTVYTPSLIGKTGEPVTLRLFSNRRNMAMTYEWFIESAPDSSTEAIYNPDGTVTISTPFEYHYLSDEAPEFTPDAPGEYTVTVRVTSVWEDRVSKTMNETAEFTAKLVVDGDDLSSAGCQSSGGFSLALLLLLGGVLAFRRRLTVK